MKSIGVFCGSSIGNDGRYLAAAEELGLILAKKQIRLVYGGANVGMMGKLANSCLENGGYVIGVMPSDIAELGIAHENLSEIKFVRTMHERKALMSELSDGFISLPGGIGTLEETVEIFTWLQLGLQVKPFGLVNVNGFYDHLIDFFNNVVKSGFLRKEHLDMMLVEKDAGTLVDKLLAYKPVKLEKWFDVKKHRV